jgi:hypothetical protein
LIANDDESKALGGCAIISLGWAGSAAKTEVMLTLDQ